MSRPSPARRPDILHLPLLGRILRWRRARLIFQLPLLLVALLIIYDGLTGPQVAPENIATVAAWLHYRGLVVLALLLAGNLFCMGCPFTLLRTVARRLSRRGWRWPRRLRNKWVAVAFFFLLLFAYERFDLWASPWLTAWVALGYFAGAFILEALFHESPFCKYVCPLGTFNFAGSTISPLQITVHEREVCRTCPGKECVNGSAQVLGCGTELFPPQMTSNVDCLFCLDCARACPYENVALAPRTPLRELSRLDAWPLRWDWGMLALVFAFTALSNAFGMVPPFYELQEAMVEWLGARQPGLALLLIFGTIDLLFPAIFGLGAAWISRELSGKREPLRQTFARYAPAIIPLAFAIWLAHYGFHFATGALSIIPVLQNFLQDHGLAILGRPDWSMSALLPLSWLLPLEMGITLVGLAATLFVSGERAAQAEAEPDPFIAQLPWLLLFLVVAIAAIYLFNLPMEMRGTSFMN